jgi:hypothetical protein
MDSWPIVIQRMEFWPTVTMSFIMKHVYFGPMCICRIVICSTVFFPIVKAPFLKSKEVENFLQNYPVIELEEDCPVNTLLPTGRNPGRVFSSRNGCTHRVHLLRVLTKTA